MLLLLFVITRKIEVSIKFTKNILEIVEGGGGGGGCG